VQTPLPLEGLAAAILGKCSTSGSFVG
jgi:hypothetical protein